MQQSRKRNVIIHAHIFKNAGTTFDSSLKNNFKDNFIDHREDELVMYDKNFIIKYIEKNEKIQAFSSHSIAYRPKKHDHIKLHLIYFLRHPIERILSVYNFQKIQPENVSIGAKMAKIMSFNEFVGWHAKDKNISAITNIQTAFLAGNGPNDLENIFEKAIINLKKTPLIGIVDRYDESMVIFEEYLKKIYPKIDLSYIIKNVTNNDFTTHRTKKIDNILQRLDDDLKKEIIDKNNYDLALYKKANQILDQKILNTNNFEKKLANFKNRCAIKKLKQLTNQKKWQIIIDETAFYMKQGINNIQFYLLTANAHKKLTQFDIALSVYKKTMKKFPDNPWAYFFEAEIYNLIGEKKKAEKLFNLYSHKFKEHPNIIKQFQII